jgi:hypothetical protein
MQGNPQASTDITGAWIAMEGSGKGLLFTVQSDKSVTAKRNARRRDSDADAGWAAAVDCGDRSQVSCRRRVPNKRNTFNLSYSHLASP